MTTFLAPTTVMLLGTAIVAGISGYFIGVFSSLESISRPVKLETSKQRLIANYDNEIESEEEDIDDECLDHAPNWKNSIEDDKKDGLVVNKFMRKTEPRLSLDVKIHEECKMVLVVRTDLGMTKGKIAAQCSHATLACYKRFLFHNPTSPVLRSWERQGQAKVTLQVKSEKELATLQTMALNLGLVAELITDAGRTQIASGNQTVLGIGPAPKTLIDQVTGNLRLL